jgi:hypothetical protein
VRRTSSRYALPVRTVDMIRSGQTNACAKSGRRPDGTFLSCTRLEAMRTIVRSGPYGERGLRNIFKNFEGDYAIDPNTPGVERKILHTSIRNSSNRKGASSELLIATTVQRNPNMTLKGLDRMLRRSWGDTDKDIVLAAYGVRCRIEVKEVSPAAQRADMDRLLGQIRKMGKEKRLTGEQQVIISRRHKLDPRLLREARTQGVRVYEEVHSGAGRPSRGLWDRDVVDDLGNRLKNKSRLRLIGPGLALGLGTYSLYSGQDELREGLRNEEGWQIAQGMTKLGAGIGSLAYAGGELALQKVGEEVTEQTLKSLKNLKRGGAILTVAMLVADQGTLLYRNANGSISAREFYVSQAGVVGAGTGTVAGGVIGFGLALLAGGPTGEEIPATLWGAGIGGAAGGVASEYGAGVVYDRKFAEVDREVQKHVLQYYRNGMIK